MRRILITGAGGSAAANFTRSLRTSVEKFFLVGTDADKYNLMRAEVDKRYLIPPISQTGYLKILNSILVKERIDFLHAQNDQEVGFISQNREKIKAKLFLPDKTTIKICHDKYRSYQSWEKAGIKIPKTFMIKNKNDLEQAFILFQNDIWLRSIRGAGGKGSFHAEDLDTAMNWLEFKKGWGKFTASEYLPGRSVAWMSVWKNGELIVAQGRERLYWELAKISPSGITGVTGTGRTVVDRKLDEIAMKSILAIDGSPHGLFGVDLTYDKNHVANPTEINIGRFFTTHQFFTVAGVNMPYIYVKLGLGEDPKYKGKKLNPLKEGLLWIRGVDFTPVLTNEKEVETYVKELKKMKKQIR
ncbi:ATP-grasp domain-containing protein [Candidatus Gottesmanbacteria bacterium]|nr:ATP-grasp domain-containing protein [Candidatus Gottesmanbacteria bacterium]